MILGMNFALNAALYCSLLDLNSLIASLLRWRARRAFKDCSATTAGLLMRVVTFHLCPPGLWHCYCSLLLLSPLTFQICPTSWSHCHLSIALPQIPCPWTASRKAQYTNPIQKAARISPMQILVHTGQIQIQIPRRLYQLRIIKVMTDRYSNHSHSEQALLGRNEGAGAGTWGTSPWHNIEGAQNWGLKW